MCHLILVLWCWAGILHLFLLLSLKWPKLCQARHWTLLTHSLWPLWLSLLSCVGNSFISVLFLFISFLCPLDLKESRIKCHLLPNLIRPCVNYAFSIAPMYILTVWKWYDLHWLRVGQRVEFKLAVLVYRCLNGQGPPYLASDLHRVADLDTRRRLGSSSSDALTVPLTRLSTVGDRAFPVATARMWNSLLASMTSSPSLSTFKRNLFTRSYPAR